MTSTLKPFPLACWPQPIRFLIGGILAFFVILLSPLLAAICIAWDRLWEDIREYAEGWWEYTFSIFVSAIWCNRWFQSPRKSPFSQ